MNVTFSYHALERCAERGITQQQALEVIEAQLSRRGDFERWPAVTYKLTLNGIHVVYDHKSRTVVTVEPRKKPRDTIHGRGNKTNRIKELEAKGKRIYKTKGGR